MDNKPKTLSKKSAIYVDIDDDLTTIVGKIRSSSGDLIALVPPKRIGILQSAVNLKLLARTAKSNNKKLVIITYDNALAVLAAGARIPTAHTLTSEPKMAEVPKLDSKDQIIESDSTPKIIKKDGSNNSNDDKEISAAVKALSDDDKINEGKKEPKNKKKSKIPNFKKFRKWIIAGVIALVALIIAIVLMVLSTNATITISAKTSDQKVDQAVTITNEADTNAEEFKIKAVEIEPVKKLTEIEFQATGKKDTGEKAKGQIEITNSESLRDVPINAGTYVFINGMRYTVDSYVSVPKVGGNTVSNLTPSKAKVNITAEVIGSEYNTSGGATATITGYNYGSVKVTGNGTTGGSKQTVTVVQQSDIDQITEKLKSDTENNNMKTDLENKFPSDVRAIPDSFGINFGTVSSIPALDEQADKAKASIEVTYSMLGIKNDDISKSLMVSANSKLGENSGQSVFDNGYNDVQVLSFQATPTGGTVRLVTTAKIGPEINDDQLKSEMVGLKKNEIKDMVEKIPGVEKVDVNYFPFWVTTAPEGKIFIIKNGF